MLIWVLGGEALGAGGGEQVVVGGDKGQGGQAGGGGGDVRVEGQSELHGIVAAQPMLLGTSHCLLDDRIAQRDDKVLSIEMAQQEGDRSVTLAKGNRTCSLAGR